MEIDGVGGVYEEKREPELHFKKLGEADSDGNYFFLYTGSRRPQTWILGMGKTLYTASALYRAGRAGRAGIPSVTHWGFVWLGGSREGQTHFCWVKAKPNIRVVGVETNLTGEEVEKKLKAGEDIVTEENIICKNHQSKQQIISRNSNDPAYCNGVVDCESGSDELCPILTVRDHSKSANISREKWEAETDFEDDQGNIVCKSPTDDWVIINGDDPRFCDGEADCRLGSDENSVHGTICDNKNIFHITKEQEGAGIDIIDDHGNIVCKNSEDSWLIVSRYDPRFCNSVPDCKSGSDELCPYGATSSLYVVTGVTEEYDGMYEEKREPTLHYKKTGYNHFLYTDIRRPQTWIIGSMSSQSFDGDFFPTERSRIKCAGCGIEAFYRAPARAGRPATTQWNWVKAKSGRRSREGEEEGDPAPSIRVVGVETNITEEELAKQIWGEDAFVTEEYIICNTQRGKLLMLENNSCRLCNKKHDCANGFDERGCPVLSFELPVICCLGVLVLGVLLHLGWKAVTRAAEDEAREMETIGTIGRQLEEAVDLIVQAAIENWPFPEDSYKILHNHSGGVDLLIGAAFSFPLDPIARHRLAQAIQKEEKKRHGDRWRSCIRRKAGSTKASAIFLDSLQPPGCLKRVAFQADKVLRWFSDSPEQEPDTWYGQLWSKAKAKVTNGFFPFLKTTSFIFDYVKDLFFFLYVWSKQAFIKQAFIKGVIGFHGLTILTSGVLMGFAIQFDNAIVNLDSFAYPNFVWLIRVVIFVATPIVPVVVILQALRLTTEKRRLEAEWRRNQESICKLYFRHSKLDREKGKVMKALADMKMVEVSTEAVPQLFILIVLIIFSSASDSCVGFLEDNDPWTITFLFVSLLQTYMTIIFSTLASINIRKGGQLDVKSKIVLGLSVSCQLAAKLWIMVFIAVAVVVRGDGSISLDLTSGVLLLVLPIPIGWAATLLLHKILKTDFWLLSTKDKLMYLLSTIWFTFPVRRMEDRDQRHKGKETFFAHLLAGLNLVGTSAAVAIIINTPTTVLIMVPSVFFYLAGCLLLSYFEESVHPWRQLEKESQCCWGTKRGIEAEPTIWDLVSVSCCTPQSSISLSQGGTAQQEVHDLQQISSNQVAKSSDFLSVLLFNEGSGDQRR